MLQDVLGRQVTVLPKMYGGDNLIVRLSSTWYTFKTDEPRKNVRIMVREEQSVQLITILHLRRPSC